MSDVKPMPLSVAIRLGAMMKPQCFHGLWDGVGSCALGAAYEAIGLTAASVGQERIERAFPLLKGCTLSGPNLPCPAACVITSNPMGMIAHLNDGHHWTREQIADWVATIEAASASSESGAAVWVEIATQ